MARARGLGVIVAFAGLGVLILAGPFLHEQTLRQATPQQDENIALPTDKAASPVALQPPAQELPAIARPVAPLIVAPPPVGFGDLERIEAREPLGPAGRAHVPSEGPPKETMLHRPIVTEAGAFEAMGYNIRLPGLLVVPQEQICGEGEAAWPCGIHARTAFRNWLRGRALACIVPPTPPVGPVVTPCRLGKLDAGAWLVGQGWAQADPDDDRYATLENEASNARRGLHGAGPQGLVPFIVTLPEMVNDAPPPAGDQSGD